MMCGPRLLYVMVAGLFLSVNSASAQSGNSGILEGQIQAETGVGVPLADIVASHTDGFTRRQAVSDAHGRFRLAFLPPGSYRLTVRRIGYRAVVVNDVLIRAGRSENVVISLTAAAVVLDSLVVNASAVHISTTDTEFGTRLTASDLALLPLPNDAKSLVAFTPGARPDQIWGAATAQANNYQLDGVTVNHPGIGGDFLEPSTSWIEEIQVRGLGAGAEYGNFQGGLVNIVTKSGSNRLQGSFRANGESWHLNSTNFQAADLGSELSHRGELDGQLRGPIVRDKLFFALFGQAVDRGLRVLNKVPQVAGNFSPLEPDEFERKLLGKLTWQPSSRNIVNGTFGRIDADNSRYGQNSFQSPEATLDRTSRTMFYNASWQRTLTTRSFLELKVAGFNGNETRNGYGGDQVPGIATVNEVNPRQYQNSQFRELLKPSSLAFSANWDTYLRIVGMEHHFKVGGEQSFGAYEYLRARNGGVTWRPGEQPGFDPAVPSSWIFGSAFTNNQVITSSWGGEADLGSKVQNSAAFAQDYIQVNRWLSINPGVRWGRWVGRLRQPDGVYFTPVTDKAFEPRIGVVADLSGNGTLVAKAHWGIFHQNMFASFYDRAEGGDVYTNEDRWEYTGPAFSDPRTTFTTAQRDANPAWTKVETIRLNEVGRVENFKEPYIDQAILGLEKSWGGHLKTEALYVRRRNKNMVAVVDRNIVNDYTVYTNISVLDRFSNPIFFGGKPLVLPKLAVSNEDIIYWRDRYLVGELSRKPPGFEGPDGTARWLALTYQPDNVLTNVPQATRRFDQLQLSASAHYPSWWAQVSATYTNLKGNLNSLTGTDDYTNSGAGPYVHLNEQFNAYGDLNNQSEVELKMAATGNLTYGFRGGVFVTYFSGDRVTPTLTMSHLLLGFALPDTSSIGKPPQKIEDFFFFTITGQRIFVAPRGTYRYAPRTSVDFHLERAFAVGRAEISLALDAFNALGANTVTSIQTSVNGILQQGEFSGYRQTLNRVPPRTFRLGAGIKF